MKELATAMFQRVTGNAELLGLLGTWSTGKSIFTRRPIVDAANRPVLVMADVASDVPSRPGTLGLGLDGRIVARTVAVYGNANDHYDKVVRVAEIVRDLFHRKPLTVVGWTNVISLVSGPHEAPAASGDVARALTVTFELRRVAP